MDSTACSFFSESTGLYFYSAVFQGNMALLGVSLVVVIYRIQQLSNAIDLKTREVRQAYVSSFGEPHQPFEPAQLAESFAELESSLDWRNPTVQATRGVDMALLRLLQPSVAEIEKLKTALARAKQGWVRPFLWLAGTALAALVLLVFAFRLNKAGTAIEFIMFAVMIIVNAIAFVELYKSIRKQF